MSEGGGEAVAPPCPFGSDGPAEIEVKLTLDWNCQLSIISTCDPDGKLTRVIDWYQA